MTTIKNRFQSKEEYKAFRAAWAKAVNDERAKSTVDVHGSRVRGWITSVDHILFNYLCGKPLNTGFSPVTNVKKLANGAKADQSFQAAFVMFDIWWRPVIEKVAGIRPVGKYDRNEALHKKVDQYLEHILTFDPSLRSVLLRAVVGQEITEISSTTPVIQGEVKTNVLTSLKGTIFEKKTS